MRDWDWRKSQEVKKVKRRLKSRKIYSMRDVNGTRVENPHWHDRIGLSWFHFYKRHSTHKWDSLYKIKWSDKLNPYRYRVDGRVSDKRRFKSLLKEDNILHFPKSLDYGYE
jgi:hypothetical protein